MVTMCDPRTLYLWSLKEKNPSVVHTLELNAEKYVHTALGLYTEAAPPPTTVPNIIYSEYMVCPEYYYGTLEQFFFVEKIAFIGDLFLF